MKLKHLGLKGQGFFCIVKQYLDETSGNRFALKELKNEHYSNADYRYRFNREISILDDLQGCENIIELIDSGHNPEKEKLWYWMPYATDNLYDYIKNHHNTLNIDAKFNLVEQVIKAIKFAHEKGVLHRDISPNNVLVFKSSENIVLKVSDFGLGKDSDSLSYFTNSSASGYGQILYVSPEQREKLKDASVKSDIYSLGKLVYFIFTGKDPNDLKQFELSSLVTKSIENNPEDRFNDICEFENHFLSLKDLLLNQQISIEYLTINDVLHSNDEKDWVQLHELLVKGNYYEHVYNDYISPVNQLLLKDNNIQNYYLALGTAFREFVKTYDERLYECYSTVRWPFTSMGTFGNVLIKIIQIVNDDETRLICLKHLWYLAFESDQWSVQKEIKKVFNEKYISHDIETQLSEFIIKSETKVELTNFSSLKVPQMIKGSIIKGNQIVEKKEKERKERQLLDKNFEW